jgi:hypothetical protein
MSDSAYVVHWEYCDKSGHGIIGVFDDDQQAYQLYDTLDQYGDSNKNYYVDTYELNTVKKGS